MNTTDLIHDRGRGPEIVGTRITVYDVLDYHTHGDHPSLIAYWLGVRPDQVEAAIEYINGHRDDVMREYQKMLDREAKGNPPEIRAKLEESHRRLQEFMKSRGLQPHGEALSAGNPR